MYQIHSKFYYKKEVYIVVRWLQNTIEKWNILF